MNRKWFLVFMLVGGFLGSLYLFIDADHAIAQNRNLKLSWSDTIKMFATELASDKYEGRNAGYKGNNKAAEYIASEFKKAGLIPQGELNANGVRTYYQLFSFRSFYTGSESLISQNVIGMIEGSDPLLKHEIVVIGAHYDHVGRVDQGIHLGRVDGGIDSDDIYNGADDNASGTATMMTIALAIKSGKIQTKRSIVFVAFSAEESGLFGSKHYCLHPVAPISDHVFMINLDMIGRNPNEPVEIKGIGSARGVIVNGIIVKATHEQKLSAVLDNGSNIDGGDSDHSSFMGVGVPFIFLFTGFHQDYHRVTDHADKLDYDHMSLIAKTVTQIVVDVANLENRLEFQR